MAEKQKLSLEQILTLARKVENWFPFSKSQFNENFYGKRLYFGTVGPLIKVEIIKKGVFKKKYNLRVVCDGFEIGRADYSQSPDSIMEIYSTAKKSYQDTLDKRHSQSQREINAVEKGRELTNAEE